jgi:DNA repair photolyase
MPLKRPIGNMYEWVTHMHTMLGGECPHKCPYCYVGRSRFGRPEKYTGPLRLLEEEMTVSYGQGKVIFINHMNDMFANEVPVEWITSMLSHCTAYPENTYIYQTKNPLRALNFMAHFPKRSVIGTTIETNLPIHPGPPGPIWWRYRGIKKFAEHGYETFVTIEPIMDCDVDILSAWIVDINPKFVNIGADSKASGLQEPGPEKIEQLIRAITGAGIEIRKKNNLERILKG